MSFIPLIIKIKYYPNEIILYICMYIYIIKGQYLLLIKEEKHYSHLTFFHYIL